MKQAARIFIILGMVFGFFLIFPIILGVFALKKLDEATKAEDITTWGIVTLICVSFIGGLLMLLLKDEDLKENKVVQDSEQ